MFLNKNLMKAMQIDLIVLDITLFAFPNYFSIEDWKKLNSGYKKLPRKEILSLIEIWLQNVFEELLRQDERL
jgi:hypothetical protein